eukprot:TRINITY_DN65856_c2_g1_i2.p1 TRINITY_DN65856_c2_g1~~TRINITY_DN65856_c2_g1_i2.p1  ORF type:complete len:418 (-),score=12.68 TRINITY_DN65856_c2_g1_i2:494-1747(-)
MVNSMNWLLAEISAHRRMVEKAMELGILNGCHSSTWMTEIEPHTPTCENCTSRAVEEWSHGYSSSQDSTVSQSSLQGSNGAYSWVEYPIIAHRHVPSEDYNAAKSSKPTHACTNQPSQTVVSSDLRSDISQRSAAHAGCDSPKHSIATQTGCTVVSSATATDCEHPVCLGKEPDTPSQARDKGTAPKVNLLAVPPTSAQLGGNTSSKTGGEAPTGLKMLGGNPTNLPPTVCVSVHVSAPRGPVVATADCFPSNCGDETPEEEVLNSTYKHFVKHYGPEGKWWEPTLSCTAVRFSGITKLQKQLLDDYFKHGRSYDAPTRMGKWIVYFPKTKSDICDDTLLALLAPKRGEGRLPPTTRIVVEVDFIHRGTHATAGWTATTAPRSHWLSVSQFHVPAQWRQFFDAWRNPSDWLELPSLA